MLTNDTSAEIVVCSRFQYSRLTATRHLEDPSIAGSFCCWMHCVDNSLPLDYVAFTLLHRIPTKHNVQP